MREIMKDKECNRETNKQKIRISTKEANFGCTKEPESLRNQLGSPAYQTGTNLGSNLGLP
jgi:hypothetical protein